MMNLREWALPVYTILIQLATGALLALWIIRTLAAPRIGKSDMDRMVTRPIMVILLTIFVAMVGAHFHLSRPYLSFLALLNLRSSWLSREILFTVLFFLTVAGLAAAQLFRKNHDRTETFLGWLAIVWGCGSIYCMSMIYELPAQASWDSRLTTISFYVTALLLGVVTALAALLLMDLRFSDSQNPQGTIARAQILERALNWFMIVAASTTVLVLALNLDQVLLLQNGNALAQTSLQLLLQLYGPLFAVRLAAVVAGVGWLVFTIWSMRRHRKTAKELIAPVYLAFLSVLIGEILGRFLFYATHIRQGI